MQVIPLQNLPNQSLSFILDGNQWDIDIRTANGTIAVDLTLNGTVLMLGARAVAGSRIIQSDYMESGNFAFICIDQSVPDYNQFGVTQSLIYISQAELKALRQPPPSRITAAYFDPLGALPLRFAPQGYISASPTATFTAKAVFAAVGRALVRSSATVAAHGSLAARGTSTLAHQGFFTVTAHAVLAVVGRSRINAAVTWSPQAAAIFTGKSTAASRATISPHAAPVFRS